MSIFTRSLSDDLASLVKQIDDTVGKNEDQKMAAFVVYLTDDKAAAETQLKAFAEKHEITNTPLTIYADKKSKLVNNYKIADDAQVTVMMWRGLKVKANHAFATGKIDKKSVAKVVADTSTILD